MTGRSGGWLATIGGSHATGLAPAAIVFGGNLVARGLGFLFPLVLAHVVGRDEFALVIFFVSTGFFVGELVLTGFPTAMTRAIAADRDGQDRPAIVASATLGGIPLLLVSLAVGALLAAQASASPVLLALVVVGLTVDAYYFALLRGLGRFGLLVGYRISANLAQILLLLAAAAAGVVDEAVAVVIYALVYVVPIVAIEVVWGPLRRAVRPGLVPTAARIRALARFAVPALVSGVAYGALVGFDVFFVRMLAPAALADYGAARSLALPVTILAFSISVVLLPRVAAADPLERLRLLRTALAVAAAGSVAAWAVFLVAGQTVIELVFPPAYAGAAGPLAVLVPGIALVGTYSILSQWWLGLGRPWPAATSLGLGALAAIAGHMTLTATLGATGAGMAIALGAGVAIALLGSATLVVARQRP